MLVSTGKTSHSTADLYAEQPRDSKTLPNNTLWWWQQLCKSPEMAAILLKVAKFLHHNKGFHITSKISDSLARGEG